MRNRSNVRSDFFDNSRTPRFGFPTQTARRDRNTTTLIRYRRKMLRLLRTFDIVGVTEREIGESIHDRLVNIARLRKSLNAAEVTIPIHVFGGLDPLLTPLYFAAGAEIFDGLGWLRYAYQGRRSDAPGSRRIA